ncbi:hypothetical protein V2G26_007567 [Clonostachys chloroleuca]
MAIPADLLPLLQRSAGDSRPIVVAMCGVAGSGKSTLSKSIAAKFPTFTRLSILIKRYLTPTGYAELTTPKSFTNNTPQRRMSSSSMIIGNFYLLISPETLC